MLKFAARGIVALLVVAAPPAARAQGTKPGTTPQAAVEDFMRALADSNLSRVADLFGNAKGPVSKTRPEGFEKRIVIMQALLHGVQAKALGDVPASKGDLRTVTTRLSHNGCSVIIPVNVVKTKAGWIVHDFDDVEGAKINQPCENSKRPGNSPP